MNISAQDFVCNKESTCHDSVTLGRAMLKDEISPKQEMPLCRQHYYVSNSVFLSSHIGKESRWNQNTGSRPQSTTLERENHMIFSTLFMVSYTFPLIYK